MYCAGCNEFLMTARDAALLSPPGAEGQSTWLCRTCHSQVAGMIEALGKFNARFTAPKRTGGDNGERSQTAATPPQLSTH